MKFDDVDKLFTELSKEYGVPKPLYCIYKIVPVKKLEPVKIVPYLTLTQRVVMSLGRFIGEKGKSCYIYFLFGNRARKDTVVHEFFHYLHYVENGWSKEGIDGEEEERRTRRETRKYLRMHSY